MAVEKVQQVKLAKTKLHQDTHKGLSRHFVSPHFGYFGGKWTFSIATSDCDSYPPPCRPEQALVEAVFADGNFLHPPRHFTVRWSMSLITTIGG